jgi:pimeloyl-ACP methyl ester carboxylesterase
MSEQKSTNGRSAILPAKVRGLRFAFGLLERVAPGRGAAWVEKIWFTVPPAKPRKSRVELPAGTPFEVDLGGRLIRGTSWGHGPSVYLVHGWGGWGLQLAAYVPPLLAAGFRVITYDAPSHGESGPGHLGGRQTDMPEMADAIRAVVAARGPAYGIVAHSIGVGALSQAMLHGLTARRLVFVAATKDFDHTLDIFEQRLGFGPRVRAGMERRFARRFGKRIQQYDLVRVFDQIQEERDLPPLLAIHDTSDQETPYLGSAAIVAAWPGARLELTEGLGHRKVLAQVDPVVAFLSTDQAVAGGAGVVQERMQG